MANESEKQDATTQEKKADQVEENTKTAAVEEETDATNTTSREGEEESNRIGQLIGLALVVLVGLLGGYWLLSQDFSCSGFSSPSDSIASGDEDETESDDEESTSDEDHAGGVQHCMPRELVSYYGRFADEVCGASEEQGIMACRALEDTWHAYDCERLWSCVHGDSPTCWQEAAEVANVRLE